MNNTFLWYWTNGRVYNGRTIGIGHFFSILDEFRMAERYRLIAL